MSRRRFCKLLARETALSRGRLLCPESGASRRNGIVFTQLSAWRAFNRTRSGPPFVWGGGAPHSSHNTFLHSDEQHISLLAAATDTARSAAGVCVYKTVRLGISGHCLSSSPPPPNKHDPLSDHRSASLLVMIVGVAIKLF